MKYKFEIRETLSRIVEVSAENIEMAYSVIKQKYRDEEIVLDSNDYMDTIIAPFAEDGCCR